MRGTIHARKTIRGSIGYPTLKGEPGEDGYSPQASVTKTGNTATITITDKSGTTTAQVTDGAKGDTGRTPEITANRTGDTTTIYSDSSPIAEIHDGTPGQDGDDGYSPSASVSKSGRIATITITDKTGTTTAQVSDGQDGTPAIIDATPTEDSPNAVSSGGVYDELTDLKSDLNQKYEKPSGGIPASDIASGVIPDVSGFYTKPSGGIPSSDLSSGIQTSLGKADTAYQKPSGGIPLTDLASNVQNVSGTTPTITGVSGMRYICGEVSTLSITPPASGIIDVIFTSGSTLTVLTVPSTVKFPDWFDPTSLVANTVYEINIADGAYGAVMTWT